MKRSSHKTSSGNQDRCILEMNAAEARAFLLKPESYCNVDLPVYFTFAPVLSAVQGELSGRTLKSVSSKPREHEDVNYSLLSNKDGRHAWRPFQLVHPALYVSLVESITEGSQWRVILDRFAQFKHGNSIKCLSLPVEAAPRGRDKAAQIQHWWQGIEQRSIELALEYSYVTHADITDCYGAIYTHSIPWAIHGKAEAKARRKDKELIGNVIDWYIEDMRHGQTNGIPQGSVLMDLVSEMILGAADLELGNRLKQLGIDDYCILRYRDDYRIFVQSHQASEQILKALTEVLIGLGLKLNTSKTTAGSPLVVREALKPDKRAWFRSRQADDNLQRHLLVIYDHGIDFPNAGTLVVALTDFHKRLSRSMAAVQNPCVLISIAVDIAYISPRAFPVCAAIISELLSVLETDAERVEVIRKIHRKLSQLPNTGHMEVWLQRISHSYEPKLAYKERLCQVVKGKPVVIWNNDWIKAKGLREAIDPSMIVSKATVHSLKPVIKPNEIALFAWERY